MSTAEQISRHRAALAQKSDEELLAITWEQAANPPLAMAARQELEARTERLEVARHKEALQRLDDLKRPHWTVLPNFWITVVAAMAALVAAVIAWLAWQRPIVAPPPISTVPPIEVGKMPSIRFEVHE